MYKLFSINDSISIVISKSTVEGGCIEDHLQSELLTQVCIIIKITAETLRLVYL